MEAKEYPKFDARGVREHYESKQREYWKREVIKEVVEEFSKWFREQSWDINGGAYIIPKMVLDRKLLMLKEPFKPS